ncbi:hypothetical protein HK105_206504 [Polyrhizophydium stewartii]|uniref:Uncharacterized protein n=1 Tax=Polyrhizophydium stewartii TaxID=2732419 RepID=A0ABR4N3I4_9FUNG|nr:hypothetical protein HK105_003622 [Polyrhizophydium stewartii]
MDETAVPDSDMSAAADSPTAAEAQDTAAGVVAEAEAPPLPQGGSHWDRLPLEMEDEVLGTAGVLTLWTAGRISTAKLSDRQRLLLWEEAILIEWSGDLATLPPPGRDAGGVFKLVRTRGMYDRLKERCGDCLETQLQHIAARNRFDDELDFDEGPALAELAAAADAVDLLADIVDERESAELDDAVAEAAAESGSMSVLRWIMDRDEALVLKSNVLDRAVRGKQTACIDFLLPKLAPGDVEVDRVLGTAGHVGAVGLFNSLIAHFPGHNIRWEAVLQRAFSRNNCSCPRDVIYYNLWAFTRSLVDRGFVVESAVNAMMDDFCVGLFDS